MSDYFFYHYRHVSGVYRVARRLRTGFSPSEILFEIPDPDRSDAVQDYAHALAQMLQRNRAAELKATLRAGSGLINQKLGCSILEDPTSRAVY